MTTVLVFDPAMCCSTGVCGPSVDQRLSRFAADLDWLAGQGVGVERLNLAHDPARFVADLAVRSALEDKGEAALPLIKVDGDVKSVGVYPTRDELATWAGVSAPRAARFLIAPAPASSCCGPSTTEAETAAPKCC